MGASRRSVRRQSYYDYSMLILIIFIVAFGLVMVYSASSYRAQISEKFNYDAAYFLKRQAISAMLGVVAMLAVSKVDYKLLIKPLPFIKIVPVVALYFISIILQIVVLVAGTEVNGAKRWIGVGSFSFQPSEITKIAIILFVAYIIYKKPVAVGKVSGMIRICAYMAIPIGLVAKENLSTAIILAVIMIGVCFVASKNKWIYILIPTVALGLLVALYINFGDGFRMERFEIWKNIETHEQGSQILQGMYAIASGGMFGTGLGQSMQKLGFIPESHNDMIFTIICEELGLVGAIVVVILFVMLIWRIYNVAMSSPDLYGGLICTGVMIQIAVQVILNICVVTNTLPSTGVALPFISYGGTSIAILLAEMGLVLSVSNRIEVR